MVGSTSTTELLRCLLKGPVDLCQLLDLMRDVGHLLDIQ